MATKDELKVTFGTGKIPTGADFADLIDGVVGPEGAQGIQGLPGTDGFGTEAQYNALVARLDALETP